MIGGVVHRIGPSDRSIVAAGWLAVWSMAVAFWLLFKPWPYPVVMILAALTPWATIWLVRRDPELSLFESQRQPGSGNLALAWGLPSLALAIPSFHQHFVDYGGLLVVAIGLGAVLWTAMVVADTHGRNRTAMAFAAVVAFAWGWGVVTAIDLALTRNNFTVVKGVVEDADWPRRGGPSLYVGATVDGRRETFDNLNVTQAIYGLHPIGAPICVEIHKGLLGSRHVYAVTCPLV
ncbi:hypothetical protein [Caulobacter hibisci]|uniref:Uncharacterized protein n=1 Tax=Caulobacter hibisci TaxID=2035993 RepID=A0ABS0SWK3_9CAUL|nr:hypothetical protein [Caulobacter hibisci]MBI1683981.1 hypothetical protein [Caulobacter hibisci]